MSQSAQALIDACTADFDARRALTNDDRGTFGIWLSGIALTAGSAGIQAATFSGSEIVEEDGQQTAKIRLLALAGAHLLTATCGVRPHSEPFDVQVTQDRLRSFASWRVTSDISVTKLAADGLPDHHVAALTLERAGARDVIVETQMSSVGPTTDFILALTGALARA